jgi:4'-phosphopantetheinyl transferase
VTSLTVSVWTVDLDQPRAVLDALRAYLDPDEVLAAAARTNDVVRNRYVVAHGALRSILATRLGIAPEAVVISRRCARCGDATHGKPAVVPAADGPGSEDLAFSLSHSQSFAVIAVVSGARVGVDIEVERPRPRLDALAARVLGSEEYADWLDLEPSAQLRGFLRCWTAKEAYLKAIGAGITLPLRDVPVEPEGWTVTSFPSPPGTVARVAVEGYAVATVEEWVPPLTVARAAAEDSSRPIDKFRNTAVGSVLAAGLMGLRDALEPERDDKVAIVQDYAGNPPFKDPIVLRLDPDHPEDSIVMVRPWLRNPPAAPAD